MQAKRRTAPCFIAAMPIISVRPLVHTNLVIQARARRLVKAGLLDKRHARRFALTSAWAELLGYCGNVALNALRISAALEREHALAQELLRRKKARMCLFLVFWGFGRTVCALG